MILVKALAYNFYGPAASFSDPNTSGVLLRTLPYDMQEPTRGSSTTIDQVEIDWLALEAPNNGDSTILSYNLIWDAGTGTVDQEVVGELVDFTETSTIVTGLTEG